MIYLWVNNDIIKTGKVMTTAAAIKAPQSIDAYVIKLNRASESVLVRPPASTKEKTKLFQEKIKARREVVIIPGPVSGRIMLIKVRQV